jgi:hypothetical protein
MACAYPGNRMKTQRRNLSLFGLSMLIGCAFVFQAAHAADADGDAIRHVLMSTFDKPEARLQVEPVVVVGNHALAGWAQGERGGRAMLYRHGGHWQVALCSGDGLKQAGLLRESGIEAADADALVAALAAAEANLPAALLAKFSSFDGLLRMDAAGHHPPGHAPTNAHGS